MTGDQQRTSVLPVAMIELLNLVAVPATFVNLGR